MAEDNNSLDESDVIFVQPPATNEEVDVVDLLADDDFDAVFNDNDTWNSKDDHSSGAKSSNGPDNSGVKSEVPATSVTTTVNKPDSTAIVTSGKRKADRGSPPSSAAAAQSARNALLLLRIELSSELERVLCCSARPSWCTLL